MLKVPRSKNAYPRHSRRGGSKVRLRGTCQKVVRQATIL
jgi:hypothetical protein